MCEDAPQDPHRAIDMAKKTRIRKFSADGAVREMARERVGSVKPARVIPDKRKTKPSKHKTTLGKLLEDQ